MKEVKKGICLWVYSECPTDAQREELLNVRGASKIIEDVGVELFNRRMSNGYYKSNDDTIQFFQELYNLIKETGITIIAGYIPTVDEKFGLSNKVTLYGLCKDKGIDYNFVKWVGICYSPRPLIKF